MFKNREVLNQAREAARSMKELASRAGLQAPLADTFWVNDLTFARACMEEKPVSLINLSGEGKEPGLVAFWRANGEPGEYITFYATDK